MFRARSLLCSASLVCALSFTAVGVAVITLAPVMAAAAMNCPGCHKDNPDAAKYCMYCGRQLVGAQILFDDQGAGSHTTAGWETQFVSGFTVHSEQLAGSNFVRIVDKAGPVGSSMRKTIVSDLPGLRLKARLKFDSSWDGGAILAPGYSWAGLVIEFRASAQQGLVSYVYYGYKSHPFENTDFAGPPKSFDRVLSTQPNVASIRLPEGQWQDLDVDLAQLLRENFSTVQVGDVHEVKLVFQVGNWPDQPLEPCNGRIDIDYFTVLRE